MAKKIVRLTESDLTRIIRRVIKEQNSNPGARVVGSKINFIMETSKKKMIKCVNVD